MLRALRKMDKDLAKQVQKALKDDIGKVFVKDVQDHIRAQGLVKSGHLLRSIKPSLRGGVLYIRSSPALNPGKKSPQGYAPIYEYGGRAGGRRGGRPFLNPTLGDWAGSGKTEAAFGKAIDRVIDRSGFSG